MLATWTGSWAAVFVIAAIFNIVAAVMALAVLRRCDAGPRHRLREKYAAAISGAKRSFSQNNAIAVRRPVMKSHLMWDSTQLKFSGAIVGMTAAVNRTLAPPCTAPICACLGRYGMDTPNP